jgi:hypothetical protein
MSGVLQAAFQNLRSFGAASSAFIGGIAVTAKNHFGYGIATDASGNSYIAGSTDVYNASTDALIVKLDSSGAVQWQRTLGTSGIASYCFGIATDPSGNCYITGQTPVSSVAAAFVAKYDTSGTLQWQRTLGTSGSTTAGYGIAVDSSGNSYITGPSSLSGTQILTAKYDTSGALQWQRTLDNSGGSDTGNAIAVDSSGNCYICAAVTGPMLFVAKYNTSGTLQWQRTLGTNVQFGFGIAVDASGNVFVNGVSQPGGNVGILFAKYDTSGTFQWNRLLDSANFTDLGRSIAVDASGFIYVSGNSNSNVDNDMYISKWDTNATLQWQRGIKTSFGDFARGVTVDTQGYYYINGFSLNTAGPNYDMLFARLPADGSKVNSTVTVGSVSVNYYGLGLTPSTPTLTSATGTLTAATSTFTDAAGSMTSTTRSLTINVVTL